MVFIPVTEITEAMKLALQVQVQQRTAEHPVDVLDSSSTSTTSSRIDLLTAALDSFIEHLSPLEKLAAQMENIEKKTENIALLTKWMMEPQHVPWKLHPHA